MSKVQVKWIDALRFVGVDSAKHSIVMSTQDEENATGLKPSDLLLIALGGCTGVDVVNILRKQRQNISAVEINVIGEQDDELPKPFRKINIEYIFRGKNLSETAILRAIQLSEEKYCSVRATVSGVAQVTHSYRVEES